MNKRSFSMATASQAVSESVTISYNWSQLVRISQNGTQSLSRRVECGFFARAHVVRICRNVGLFNWLDGLDHGAKVGSIQLQAEGTEDGRETCIQATLSNIAADHY